MSTHYTATAKALHWGIAVLIFGMLALGFYMTGLDLSPTKLQLFSWHKWAGVTVFMLVVVRLAWRVTHRPPALVSVSLRVVRTISLTPRCSSSAAIWRVTTERASPSWLATAAKLPRSATRTKICIASSRFIVAIIAMMICRLSPISLRQRRLKCSHRKRTDTCPGQSPKDARQ